MEITSNHLEVMPFTDEDAGIDIGDTGEEISKRVPTFGHPVGKRTSPSTLRCNHL